MNVRNALFSSVEPSQAFFLVVSNCSAIKSRVQRLTTGAKSGTSEKVNCYREGVQRLKTHLVPRTVTLLKTNEPGVTLILCFAWTIENSKSEHSLPVAGTNQSEIPSQKAVRTGLSARTDKAVKIAWLKCATKRMRPSGPRLPFASTVVENADPSEAGIQPTTREDRSRYTEGNDRTTQFLDHLRAIGTKDVYQPSARAASLTENRDFGAHRRLEELGEPSQVSQRRQLVLYIRLVKDRGDVKLARRLSMFPA
ncbi:hypothetical protein BKA70DRAFT_1412278 [Coprinopsis sp. MPI-PUGE-AT-0042]|nr:hypothetical protein BKA70DRAFT_1412278 [Coprinopsis sp. MPI-PUGE-AT-0042]